jgi:predicted short-subunit dehydrogenase-like oxidoreductase (DUF2520 family)
MAAKANIRTRVVIIGSGNLAWHIVSHLVFFKRFEIFVYNRSTSLKLKQLKKEFKVFTTDNWDDIPKDAGIFFICTGDSSIKEVASKLRKLKTKALVLHTSGTANMSLLRGCSTNKGVFYPLQTFTFGQSVNWFEVPIFVEASNKISLEVLTRLAKLFSGTVVNMDSEKRMKLHLAAVIAGNFSNAMYSAAHQYLSKELHSDLFTYLLPLISRTAKKVKSVSPAKAQTGPAVRNDKITQKTHLQLLKKHPDLKKLYKSISKLIMKQQKADAKF